MNARFTVVFAALLTLASVAMSQSLSPSKHHTSVRLLADVESVMPGATFTVGVLMTMDDGWHTYWKNSGEAGLPTTINWTLPNGFTEGEIIWPLPEKHKEGEEVITFGYGGETMLLVPIMVSADVRPGTMAVLRGEVDWLECEKICIPGSASVELRLPVKQESPLPANTGLFARYRAQVPMPYSADDEVIIAGSVVGKSVEFQVKPRGKQGLVVQEEYLPDFYPYPNDGIVIERTVVRATASSATLRVPLSVYAQSRTPATVGGVVVYQLEGGGRKGVYIEVPLAAEQVGRLPLFGSSGGSIFDREFESLTTKAESTPLYIYFVFAIIGGLILNIMPCVLPVIALKVFGLVRMGGEEPRRVKAHGFSFSAGIIGSFLVLALLVIAIQAAGNQVGWGFQFQEPLFIVAMCAIVFAFGLSLFGVYEIGLSFTRALSGVSVPEGGEKGGGGYTASVSEGVFATILATPCTAPILGTALGFAFSQPPAIILLMFASVGFGMALPYLILSMRPAWTKYLPKPGQWMVTAKQFMGFLMMGTLIWLLYVLGRQLGMEAIIWTSAFLLSIGIACWIYGRFVTLSSPRSKNLRTLALSVAIVIAGYVYFMETVLDVRAVIAGVGTTATGSVETDPDGIPWEPFTLARLEDHLQQKQAVFIDFTADWCLTCKVNERTVLTNSRVVEAIRSRNVVAIKADWTNRNPDITRLLAKFGRSGVPLYVVFPAGDPNSPIVLPEVITAGMVIEAIERAAPIATVAAAPPPVTK
jgi:thiol:disulfide interchange protein/DsbC/DsbD-like thiol-disulfide interchange protein